MHGSGLPSMYDGLNLFCSSHGILGVSCMSGVYNNARAAICAHENAKALQIAGSLGGIGQTEKHTREEPASDIDRLDNRVHLTNQ